MARPGRKRKLNAVRRATTTAERRPNLPSPVEIIRQRLVAAGLCISRQPLQVEVAREAAASLPPKTIDWINSEAERRFRATVFAAARRMGLMQAGPEYPIDMLHAAGQLIGPGEDHELAARRAAAAARYAELHWRLFGYPSSAHDNGYRSPPNEEQIQAILERAGRLDSDEPLSPDQSYWLMEARHKAMRWALMQRGHHVTAVTLAVVCQCMAPRPAQLDALRVGLQALADARLPTRDEIPEELALAS